ncbi:unnamed protein product [Camellia sinensis]
MSQNSIVWTLFTSSIVGPIQTKCAFKDSKLIHSHLPKIRSQSGPRRKKEEVFLAPKFNGHLNQTGSSVRLLFPCSLKVTKSDIDFLLLLEWY